MEEKVGITDLINRIVQVLKKDLYWVKISKTIGRGVAKLHNYIYIKYTHILIYLYTKRTDILTYQTLL